MKHSEDELDAGAVLLHRDARLLHLTVIVERLLEPEVEQGWIGALHLDTEHGRVRGVRHDMDGQDIHQYQSRLAEQRTPFPTETQRYLSPTSHLLSLRNVSRVNSDEREEQINISSVLKNQFGLFDCIYLLHI